MKVTIWKEHFKSALYLETKSFPTNKSTNDATHKNQRKMNYDWHKNNLKENLVDSLGNELKKINPVKFNVICLKAVLWVLFYFTL